MSINRIDRVNELLLREVANCLYRVQLGPVVNLAQVTLSQVQCSPDLRKARIAVSVMDADPDEADAVVRILNGRRKDIQKLVSANVILKYTPHLQFVRDDSMALGSRVLEIMDRLPPPASDDEDETDGTLST